MSRAFASSGQLKRSLAIVVALTALVHAETRPRYGGTIEASLLGAPVSFDPTLAQSHAELEVVGLVYDTVYAIGPDGAARPQLAAGPPITDSAKTTVRIALRKGVKFHDGSELTALDVVASLERARKSPARFALAPIATLRADGDAFEVGLRVPGADVAALLALPQLAITKGGRPPAAQPVGTGPFAFEAIDRSKHRLALRAFDDHFAGRPYLDTLVLRWFDTPDGEARRYETNGAQVSARGVTAFAGGSPMYRAGDLEGPAALLVFVGFGHAHGEITGNLAFRRALDLALGRGAIATIGSGEHVIPAQVPVPVEAGGSPISAGARAGNLDAARATLAAVPAFAPGKLAAMKLEILVEDTRPDDREIAERVLRALDKLGIAVTITALGAPAMRERIARGQTDLWIGQLAEPVASPTAWWGAAFAAAGDDWLERKLAGAPLDVSATAKAFAERLPIVPLAFRSVRIWYRSDVHGLGFDAAGRVGFADAFLFGDPVKSRKP